LSKAPYHVARLLDGVDEPLDRWEEMLIHECIARTIGHIIRSTGVWTSKAVTLEFINFVEVRSLSELHNRLRSIATAIEVASIVGQHSSTLPLQVASALHLLQANHRRAGLRLCEVAAVMNLSPYHLSHLLAKHTGHSWSWHLNRVRVIDACELLTTTSLSIKEIAAAVGFSSTHHLDRHFVAVIGMTPTTFRTSPGETTASKT
jgi:AraC-like DNA-binding protein